MVGPDGPGGRLGGGTVLISGGIGSVTSGGDGSMGLGSGSCMTPRVARNEPYTQTFSPTALISSSALLRSTTPSRIV